MNIEKRTYNIELRAAENGEGRTIEGMGAITDQETDLGYFIERIEPGAFNDADISDVRALFNHNPDAILARTKSGTLTLEKKEEGLFYRFTAPNTTAGNDLVESMKRGDIDQSSFAFTIADDEWRMETRDGKEREVRTIKKVAKVYDVSPVTYPAYEGASAALRSHQDAQKEYEKKQEEKRQALVKAAQRKRRLRLLEL